MAYLLNSADEFGAENDIFGVGFIKAIGYFIGGVAEIQRHGDRARAQDAEIDGQPLKAIHQQYCYLIAFLYSSREEKVCKAV